MRPPQNPIRKPPRTDISTKHKAPIIKAELLEYVSFWLKRYAISSINCYLVRKLIGGKRKAFQNSSFFFWKKILISKVCPRNIWSYCWRNAAPPGMYKSLQIMGWTTYQVVSWISCMYISLWKTTSLWVAKNPRWTNLPSSSEILTLPATDIVLPFGDSAYFQGHVIFHLIFTMQPHFWNKTGIKSPMLHRNITISGSVSNWQASKRSNHQNINKKQHRTSVEMKSEPMGAFSWLTLYTSSVCVCVFCQMFVANAENGNKQSINWKMASHGKSACFGTNRCLSKFALNAQQTKQWKVRPFFSNCVLEDV